MWLPLGPSGEVGKPGGFLDLFEDLFHEHVEYGSTGKAFIKGFKRERESNMLWKVQLRAKLEEGGKEGAGGVKVKSKRKSGASPDQGAGSSREVESGKERMITSGSVGMKERVKKRRAVAKSGQSRSMPKMHVDTSLQMSAIEVSPPPSSAHGRH